MLQVQGLKNKHKSRPLPLLAVANETNSKQITRLQLQEK